MNGADRTTELTLRGIVAPIEWGPTGEIRTVAIFTRDEKEYEVAPGGAGSRLMSHVRSEVLAQAETVNEPGDGVRVRVNSFAVLEWNEPDRNPP